MGWPRWQKMKLILDISHDGQIDLIDITLWILALVFTSLSFILLLLGSIQCYLAFYYTEQLESLIKYIVTLTQIFGTFGTLIYSIAFINSTNNPTSTTPSSSSSSSNNKTGFFDFDKDGDVGLVDIICTFTGIIHTILILLNGLIWYLGYYSISDIVDFVVANTRVIILILTKSYLLNLRDPIKCSYWNFYIDVNHDGVVELVDILAVIFNTSYIGAVLYSFYILVICPIGNSDLSSLIQLTSQINFVLISAFASVYLSNQPISLERKRILEFVALFFLLLLSRTLIEISISIELFKAISKLLNGLVLGITQLFIGIFIMQAQSDQKGKQS